MRIKLDENLPARLVPILQRHGHDVDTVPEEHLSGRPESGSWKSALDGQAARQKSQSLYSLPSITYLFLPMHSDAVYCPA